MVNSRSGSILGSIPAQWGEAEEALLMPGDEKADLVQVGVQQHLFGPLPAAAPHPHHAAHTVQKCLVHQGAEQLQSRPAAWPSNPLGPAGRTARPASFRSPNKSSRLSAQRGLDQALKGLGPAP